MKLHIVCLFTHRPDGQSREVKPSRPAAVEPLTAWVPCELAEDVGFEPTVPFGGHFDFQGRCLNPLGQSSVELGLFDGYRQCVYL